jgi:hypothetical protein
MPEMGRRSESEIKSDPLYINLVQKNHYWHAFEGCCKEALSLLSDNLLTLFPEKSSSYELLDDGSGLKLTACDKASGSCFPHYAWRAATDRYFLLVPNATFIQDNWEAHVRDYHNQH